MTDDKVYLSIKHVYSYAWTWRNLTEPMLEPMSRLGEECLSILFFTLGTIVYIIVYGAYGSMAASAPFF